MAIGSLIKEYLDSKGISQRFISEKTRISEQKLSQLLNGKRNIKVEEYFAICRACEVPVTMFYTEEK